VTVGGTQEVWGAEVVWVWVAVVFEGAVERGRFWVEMEGMLEPWDGLDAVEGVSLKSSFQV